MATTIVTKNSSTASAVPTAGQLVQGELAVNVADKKLYTEDNAGSIIVLADGVKLAGIEALADVTDTANVTAAGALMDSELTSIASVKALNQGVATTDSPTFAALTSTGEITANGGIALGDNDVATFGDDDDLRISHDGTHSKIQEVGTGDLKIQASNLLLEAEDGTNYIYAVDNGSVRLYHPDATNGIKLTTTSTGIDVTGQINASTNLVAGTSVYSNNGVYYGSSTLSLKNSSAGSFVDFASNGNATFFGTATMDGLTSQLTADAQGKFSGWSPTGSTSTAHGAIELGSIASYQGIIAYDGSSNTRFLFDNSWSGTGSTFEFRTNTAATAKTHLKVEGTGDISFYEDTGTTAKLFWDASAESLGIGTTSPSLKGHINNASSGLPATSGTTQTNGVLRLSSSATSGIIDFGMNSSSPWIQATDYTGLNNNYNLLLNPNGGNVGIGTSSPAANRSLHVSSAPQNQARFERTGASTVQIEFQDSTTTNQPSLGGDGDSLTFRTSFTERLRINSSGNVGINETVPFGKLHISDTQTGRTTADSAGNLLVLEDDENGMSILSADAGAGYILFGDTASSASGGIVYDHSANKFNFRTNEAWNRMILDSSGNLLVGTTSPSAKLTVEQASANANGAAIKNQTVDYQTLGLHNAATSGDNFLVSFVTDASSFRGSIAYNRAGGLIAYNTTSDYRAKDISGPVTDSGVLIDSTPVYMGKMKGATQERPMFIAHEVPAYAHTGEKDAVDADGNPIYQQMDVSALVPVMWAEIQSLRNRVAQLEA
jgi:hypothetical protein